MRIACVGDNCIDRFLAPLNYALVGGNAVNVAVQLARLGVQSAYFGAAGNDGNGERLRHALVREGVGLDGLRLLDGQATATTDIATAADGERHFIHEDFGACADYRPGADDIERLKAFDHVHIGWLNDAGELKRRLRSAGVSVSQDLSVNNGPENLSPGGLTVAFASAEEANAGTVAQRLLAGGAAMAVVTMGAAGSLATGGRTLARSEAVPVTPIDTTGAGDSFIAGFLSAWLNRRDMDAALRAAAAHASTTCLHIGGFSQPLLALE